MDHAYWPGLDRHVRRLGMGCWQLAGEHLVDGRPHGWGRVESRDAVQVIRQALDAGVEFFDTAASYGHGVSEKHLGLALRNRQEAVVCTKIPLTTQEEAGHRLGPDFESRVEQSLVRLKRDRIDVLLLHNPADEIDWRRFDTTLLEALRSRGKIRSYGVSCRSYAGLCNAVGSRFGSCVEWSFHLLERRPAMHVFAALECARMNFIARSPLARGLLASRGDNAPVLYPDNDFRSTLPHDWIEWTTRCARAAQRALCSEGNPVADALRYCLSFDAVSVVIPGMRNALQLQDALQAAAAGRLPAPLIAALDQEVPPCYPPWTVAT